MISWLSEKYGGSKSHDQIVAIAASECNVSRKNDIGLDAGIRAALHLAHYKEKYPALSLHENLAKAYHKIMMIDDMIDDMLENGKEQPLDAIFLQLALDFEDTISVRETKNYIRKRQFEPSECEAGTYRTFTLASGKKAVGCKVKGKFKVQSILEKKDLVIRVVHDNFDELVEWVRSNIKTDDPEGVAFAIIKSRKKKGKESKKEETREEKEKSWFDEWQEIAGELEKRRKARAEPTPKEKIQQKVKQLKIREGSPKKEILQKVRKEVDKETVSLLNSLFSGINDPDEIIAHSEREKYKHNIATRREISRITHYHLSRLGAIIPGRKDLTEDAAPKTASYRAPRAGTPAAMAGGARRTTVGQALKEQGVPLTVSGPEAVTLPFKILNTETGELVEGEMIENLDKGTAQMQPVSSSNVRSVGQAQNELVVAFHSTGEGRFYRFKFSNQEMASEARNALLDSSSPGRWIWHNIRGHQAGEAVTPSKIGPAITSGKPTIGGTSASLVNYRITPVGPSRVKGYKEAHEKLQRQTSNPSTNPNTGARIEGLLGARKGFRELGRKIRQDHACDFTMEGMLTRSGEFDYRAEGQGIKIKTPENLKWIAENTDHVPVFGKRERGSHQESEYSLIGFAHQFKYIPVGEVDDYAHIYGKTELFKDIKDLSDLEDPRELPVSFGFDDIGEGGVQKIIRLHHLAVSLNKIERDRCSTMDGPSCTISPVTQVDMRQKLEIKPLKTVVVSLKK